MRNAFYHPTGSFVQIICAVKRKNAERVPTYVSRRGNNNLTNRMTRIYYSNKNASEQSAQDLKLLES